MMNLMEKKYFLKKIIRKIPESEEICKNFEYYFAFLMIRNGAFQLNTVSNVSH